MKFITRQFHDLRQTWDSSGIGYEVRRTAGAFLILAVIGFLICRIRPDIQNQVMAFILSVFSSADVYTESGEISAAGLFINNLRACFVSVMYGIIPFLYLPALTLGTNAMILGVMASYYISNGYSITLYLASLLPHGIFELPALVLGIACGLLLCRNMSRDLHRKPAEPAPPSCTLQIARIFLLLITPLLAFAALAEAYLTPLVIEFFL